MAARTWLLVGIGVGFLAAGDAAAQGMALTEPREPAPQPVPAEAPAKRAWMLTAREAAPRSAGHLPNQTVGPKRDRVVRDICIGCGAP